MHWAYCECVQIDTVYRYYATLHVLLPLNYLVQAYFKELLLQILIFAGISEARFEVFPVCVVRELRFISSRSDIFLIIYRYLQEAIHLKKAKVNNHS